MEVFMSISKKLFLMAAIALNMGSLLNAYNEHTFQSIFNFAVTLSKQEDSNAKVTANWLIQKVNQAMKTYHIDDISTIDRIELILNAPLTLEEKVERLTQLQPSLIRKYIIAPLNIISPTIKKSIAISTTAAAIVAAAAVLPAITTFSTDMGSFAAKECISYISNPQWYSFLRKL